MKQYLDKGDACFALLLAVFLNWYESMHITEYTWTLAGRLAGNMVYLFVMLEVALVALHYLRGKPLFGRAKSQYFEWSRTLPLSILISGGYALFYYFYLPSPLAEAQVMTLIVGAVLATCALMLYFYSLVKR